MREQEITCEQSDDLLANTKTDGPVSISVGKSSDDNWERTWCDHAGRDFLREHRSGNICQHWRIVDDQ